MAATVEWQEIGPLTRQPRRHMNLIRIRREVDQRPVLELKQRSPEIPLLVLLHRVPPVLASRRILQLAGRHRQPVDRQQNLHCRIGRWMTSHLPRQCELVLREKIIQLVIQPMRRREIRQLRSLAVELEPVPEIRRSPCPIPRWFPASSLSAKAFPQGVTRRRFPGSGTT